MNAEARKYFGTDGIRGHVGDEKINPEFVLRLGWTLGKVLSPEGGGKVLIGKDTRISGYMLESALEAGLSAAGVDIHLLGPMPTPAIAYLTRTLRACAGIVISASHNPYHDNGIKFFCANGKKFPETMELAIEKKLQERLSTVDSVNLGKAERVVDAPGRYIEYCKSTISANIRLNGMKIIVDCANGACYHVAPCVFRELGAEVIELGVNPDGLNINVACGSTKPEVLQKIVLAEKADVGIALDGDGDRLIMVDSAGEVVDGDELLYIIAESSKRQGYPIEGVVGTVMSNLGLEFALKELGLGFQRTQVGDRYVIEALEKNAWPLGGEPSGHIICRGVTTTGDGIIAALQVLCAMCSAKKGLSELKQGMKKFPQTLVNVPFENKDAVMNNPKIQDAVKAVEMSLADEGRVILRPSGTEPVLRVMVEGRDAEQVHRLANQLAHVVAKAS